LNALKGNYMFAGVLIYFGDHRYKLVKWSSHDCLLFIHV